MGERVDGGLIEVAVEPQYRELFRGATYADLARGVRWDDPEIGIRWPLADPIMSARDRALPFVRDRR